MTKESLIKKHMRFPRRDIDCRAVVPFQIGDVEKALKYVKKFDTCLQAGGNVGYWPLYLSDKFKKVYTYEPDKENYECLEDNIGHVPNITYARKALGDKRRAGSLDGDPRNCGAYQIDETGDDFEIITIDSLKLKALDLLCLDIEGYELKALMGAENTIKKHSPVIMLEDKGLSDRYGTKQGYVENWLAKFGYEVVERVHRDIVLVRS